MFDRLFDKRGLSLDRLRVLLLVREKGGLSKAAPDDPVRQSQYSRQLKELEAFFGVPLTERKGKALVLTADGHDLANRVNEHLASLDSFRSRVAHDPITVHIGAGESFIHWLLLPRMPALRRGGTDYMPRLQNLSTGAIAQGITERSLDFGLLRGDAIPPGAESVSLGILRHSLFVPGSLMNERGPRQVRRLLESLPIAALSTELSMGRQLRSIAEQASFRINVRLECNTFTALGAAVQSGGFAAVLPDLATEHLGRGIIRVAASLLKPMEREVFLAWRKRSLDLRPELETTQRWLVENLRFGGGRNNPPISQT